MKRCLSIVFCLAFLSLGVAGNATADLMNGGFEDGPKSSDDNSPKDGWSVTDATSYSSCGVNNVVAFPVHTGGSYSFFFGAGNFDNPADFTTGYDTLTSSNFTTTANSKYTVTFWIYLDTADFGNPGTTGNSLNFSWNGTTTTVINDTTENTWVRYSIPEEASGSSTYISFSGRNPLAYFLLDDVSVSVAVVPEPSTFLIYATGLLVLACARRWVRRA